MVTNTNIRELLLIENFQPMEYLRIERGLKSADQTPTNRAELHYLMLNQILNDLLPSDRYIVSRMYSL